MSRSLPLIMWNTYFNLTVIAEWSTFLAALVLLSASTGRWRWFIALLGLILITETTGWYYSYILHKRNNALPFNILLILTGCFFLWIISTAGLMKQVRKVLHFSLLAFILFALINLLFIQGMQVYNSMTEILADMMLAISSGYLIIALIRDDSIEENLFTVHWFWLATGILFSATGSFLLYFFLNELQAYYDRTKTDVYGYINYTVNILLYTCLIVAFICRRNKRLLQD